MPQSKAENAEKELRQNGWQGRVLVYLKSLGPGLITGASDDDPSGIGTYSQTGAQFGYAQLWMAIFTFPLMTAVQEMCARIALHTGRGLADIIREYYPKAILYISVLLLFIANTINIIAPRSAPVIPTFQFNKDYMLNLVAVLGTTISPYLFFWQPAQEVEEDIDLGKTTKDARKGVSRTDQRDRGFGVLDYLPTTTRHLAPFPL